MAVLAEAALPPAPLSKVFFKRLQRSVENNAPPPHAALYRVNEPFQQPKQPKTSEDNQRTAPKAALEYDKVLDTQGISLTNLDDWMAG